MLRELLITTLKNHQLDRIRLECSRKLWTYCHIRVISSICVLIVSPFPLSTFTARFSLDISHLNYNHGESIRTAGHA